MKTPRKASREGIEVESKKKEGMNMKGLIRRVGSGERGFTLIELLVVIAILGIIAAVVLTW